MVHVHEVKKSAAAVASILLTASLLLVSARNVQAAWVIDTSGTLIQVDASVLGDSDEEGAGEPETEQAETEAEGTGNREEGIKRDIKTLEREQNKLEQQREMAKKKLEKDTEGRKKQLEKNKQNIKTTIENREQKLKVRQETMREGEQVKETETDLPENETLEIEREDGKKVRIRPVGAGESLEIQGEKVRTRTNFPIKIGENNELIHVNKDGTERILTVLPDAAKAAMEKNGFTSTEGDAELEESQDGKPIYKFEAQEEKRVFGFIRRKFKKSVEISAETGEVVNTVSTENSAFARLLERLSL